LAQIQELITQAPEIGNDKKLMALEQVKVLAESSANPTNPNKRKVADQAMMILKGIASSLPDAAKLTDSLSKLLTSVSSLLGLL
jgi:internalin A